MDGQRWGTLPGSAEQGWPRCLGSAAFLFQDLLFFVGALDIGVVLGCRKSARHRADACWMLSSCGDSGCFCGGC